MRQIVLDTETTGLSHEAGHRIIEIGCVEIIERRITNNHFHRYLNPERQVDEEAFQIHGLSNEFLGDKPLFADTVQQLIEFIDGAELIIHNAPFDTGFIDAELTRLQWPQQLSSYCTILDTLELARNKHPGQRNNLDALCKRYAIDNSNRQLHGALLDAEILASVYLAMTSGQCSLFEENNTSTKIEKHEAISAQNLSCHALIIEPNNEELESHLAFVQYLQKKSGIDRWAESKSS